jgi:hypothetical protein
MAAAALFVTVATAFAQVNVVRDGKASAVVVTAVKPTPVAAYAAEELVNHVEKATGQRLAVVTEAEIPDGYESRIFVGMTDAAAKQGIDASQLDIEQSVLRTVGSDLYIIGKELRQEDYKGTRAHPENWNNLSTEVKYSAKKNGVNEEL